MTANRDPLHTMSPVQVQGDQLKASCTCGGWYRTVPDEPGGGKRLAELFVDHVQEWRR